MDLIRVFSYQLSNVDPIQFAIIMNRENNKMNPNYAPVHDDNGIFREVISFIFCVISYILIALITIMVGVFFEMMDTPNRKSEK